MATTFPAAERILTGDQVRQFEHDGFLVLKRFWDLQRDIEPIQRGIWNILGIVLHKYGIPIDRGAFDPSRFDTGYLELIQKDRRIGGEIYDAVKQIPAFVRFVAHPKHDALVSQIRGTDMPGVAAGGYGIRIDNPGEDKFRANWHQDYPSQFRSIDGLVFWSPLVPITEDVGPVHFAVASHKDGLAPVLTKDPDNPEKTGAYALRLANEKEKLAKYKIVAPLSDPGDLVIIDFLNLHASGYNRSKRSRWSMQIRHFNFRDPTGIKLGWTGSFAAGKAIRDVHPELIAD